MMRTVIIAMAFFLFASYSNAQDITLMFPKIKSEKIKDGKMVYTLAKTEDGKQEYIDVSLKDFVERFRTREYAVEHIEIWVEGKAESDKVAKFFVSMEGTGGCKITIRPNR